MIRPLLEYAGDKAYLSKCRPQGDVVPAVYVQVRQGATGVRLQEKGWRQYSSHEKSVFLA